MRNWPDSVVMWMRNGKWTKKIDYGESKDKNINWPKNLYHGIQNQKT